MVIHTIRSLQIVDSSQIPSMLNELLYAHIVLALIAYGLFTVSFIIALLYFTQYRLLKWKKGYKWLKRLSDLEGLEKKVVSINCTF